MDDEIKWMCPCCMGTLIANTELALWNQIKEHIIDHEKIAVENMKVVWCTRNHSPVELVLNEQDTSYLKELGIITEEGHDKGRD